VMTSLVVAMAVDRGYLRYEDPIEKHWPEYPRPAEGRAPTRSKNTCACVHIHTHACRHRYV
jgi:CubicO group peptidase (beta-lactamase class C family)